MSERTRSGWTWVRRGIVAGLAASGLVLAWSIEQGSLERANRLHRDGALDAAARLYAQRLGADTTDVAVRYNLGTTFLERGDGEAVTELEDAATRAADQATIAGLDAAPRGSGDVRARALYNAGVYDLRRALDGTEGDSVRVFATAAVAANRSALRLRPDHADTKWNLAIAQRLLDSIRSGDQRSPEEMAESSLAAEEVVQSENVLELDEENEIPEDAPMTGEDEARATTDEDPPMSQAEAAEILTGDHLDPELLLRKLFALEGRTFWGRRAGVRGPRR